MKIGIRLESLGLPLRSALSQAAQMGVKGVQIDSVGELAPERLTDGGSSSQPNGKAGAE